MVGRGGVMVVEVMKEGKRLMLPVCWEAAEPHPRRGDSAGKPTGLRIELRL